MRPWACRHRRPFTKPASPSIWRTGRQGAESQRQVADRFGDGEADEPEVLGTINIAAREEAQQSEFGGELHLQRLKDGPVRGNEKKSFRSSGHAFHDADWNVLKVIWGRRLGRAAGQRSRRRITAAHG